MGWVNNGYCTCKIPSIPLQDTCYGGKSSVETFLIGLFMTGLYKFLIMEISSWVLL